jgi:hypothetical protein
MPSEMIPIVLFLVMGMVGVSFSPLGRALSRRLGGADPGDVAEVEALRGEVAKLREELRDVRGELAEATERLDFAERLLAQIRQKNALPGAT